MSENYAAVLHGPFNLRIEKWPIPEINEHEVLIEMLCVGICGSDLKMYSTGKCGRDFMTDPVVMGHEGAGKVVKIGSKVTTLQVGDRVAIEPTQPCRACQFCKQGRYNLCPKQKYCSTSSQGNLCRYYKHVADFCHKIPDNLSMEEGAAIQPLAVALHACNRANIKVGYNVVIFGAGPIGILCAMSARAMGARKILMTDLIESRLTTARAMVADHTVLTKEDDTESELAERFRRELGDEPDVTIDACGATQAQRVAMMITKSGGTLLVVGIGEDKAEVPLTPTLLREVDIRGSIRILNMYPAALSAVSSGRIPLDKFITHHFPLEKVKQALDLAKTGEAMKIIIHVQQ